MVGARCKSKTPRNIRPIGPETRHDCQGHELPGGTSLAPSLSSEPEVSALAHCHAAISPLLRLTSAHIRNPGCRYADMLANYVRLDFAISLASSLNLWFTWQTSSGERG